MQPLGLGVVGAGTLARRVLKHLVLPDVVSTVVVTHICDTAPGRADAAARDFGVPRSSVTLDELLGDPSIDAVTIASPISLHYEQGLAAIRAGKHVHFNKTMSVSLEEADQLIDEASLRGVQLVASPGEMLRPHHRRVRRLIEEGAIGQLCWAACGAALGTYHEDEPERSGDGSALGIDPSWYFRVPGGGPLYDMTVYALHAITGILGEVRRVTAMSGVRIKERHFGGRAINTEAHDNTLMLLDFGENVFGFAYGTAAGILSEGTPWDPNGRYYGTAGEIVGKTLNGSPFDYPGKELADQDLVGDQWLLPHVGPAHRPLVEQHVFEDVMQLVDLVREGTPTAATPEHARHVIEIIEASYRAAAHGVTQQLRTSISALSAAQ
ncbi:MAG: Gfo/Idh/MocA family oxidoreductase [Actinomycetota bacterium]|nr:Gfo/Idh/MocA family oxidoreductase [Actinomycetota bacterium]